MRKRLKKKKRSCAMCKPHKMAKSSRIVGKALQDIKEFEKLKHSLELCE